MKSNKKRGPCIGANVLHSRSSDSRQSRRPTRRRCYCRCARGRRSLAWPPLITGLALSAAAPPGKEEKVRGSGVGRRGREGTRRQGGRRGTEGRRWRGEIRDPPRHALGVGERGSMTWSPCRIAGSASGIAGGPSSAQKLTVRHLMFNYKKIKIMKWIRKITKIWHERI